MRGRITISRAIREAIRSHASRAYPEECCGLVLGRILTDESRIVEELVPSQNRAPVGRKTGFQVAEEALLEAAKRGRAQNLEIVGLYHSHPNQSSLPSERDRLLATPFYSYLIVGGGAVDWEPIRCWRLSANKERFVEELIHDEK